jgi:hypothetical protein
LDSTSAVRDLVLSFRTELLGLQEHTAAAQRDPREQVRELTDQFLNRLLGMDVDLS